MRCFAIAADPQADTMHVNTTLVVRPGGRSLQFRFLAVFLVVAVLNVVGASVVVSSIVSQRTDALVINLAGAQRMLSQRIAKELLLLQQSTGGDGSALRASMARFEL